MRKPTHTKNLRKVIKVSVPMLHQYSENMDALALYYFLRGTRVRQVIYGWSYGRISHQIKLNFYSVRKHINTLIDLKLVEVRGKNLHIRSLKKEEKDICGAKRQRHYTLKTENISSLQDMEDALRLKLIELHGHQMHHAKTSHSLTKIQYKVGLRTYTPDTIGQKETNGQIEKGCVAIRMSAKIVQRVAYMSSEQTAGALLRRLENKGYIVRVQGKRHSDPISKKGFKSVKDTQGGYYYKGRYIRVEANYVHFVHQPIVVADLKQSSYVSALISTIAQGSTKAKKALSRLKLAHDDITLALERKALEKIERRRLKRVVSRIEGFLGTYGASNDGVSVCCQGISVGSTRISSKATNLLNG